MTPSRLQFYIAVITPGAILMALEMVSSRILAPHFGSSVYVWGSIIGVFLAAMSIGYFWGGKLADRQPNLAVLGRLVVAAALTQTLILLAGTRVVAFLGNLTGGSPTGTLIATTVLFGPVTVFLAAVSPYAVKLATRDLQLLGGTAGHLYALSTGGSLVGTLGATFVLIPRLDLESILRLLLAITAVVSMIALVSAARQERLTLTLAAGLLLLALIPGTMTQEAGLELLADRVTPYQTLRVSESDGVRFLHSDGTIHAAVILENLEPWLEYTRQAGTALLLDPDLESMLVLGMGSGGVGTYLQRQLPELRVDYVDIDPAIPELAREFMFFEDSERAVVHVDDGRRFLSGRPDVRWDFIYVDTYIGHSIPFHMSTIEFFEEVRSHLNPGGIFGLNLISSLESPFAQAILRSVTSVFDKLYVFTVPGGNYLFLATDRVDAPDHGQLVAAARQLDPQFDFDPSLEKMATFHRVIDFDRSKAMLLTDRFAPVNHLIRMNDAAGGEIRFEKPSEEPSVPPSDMSDDGLAGEASP
ncbi:MAG: fused MFS/spermidine synthase [Acidobacteriota bacterium]